MKNNTDLSNLKYATPF